MACHIAIQFTAPLPTISSEMAELDSDEEYQNMLAEDDISSIYQDWLEDMKRVVNKEWR